MISLVCVVVEESEKPLCKTDSEVHPLGCHRGLRGGVSGSYPDFSLCLKVAYGMLDKTSRSFLKVDRVLLNEVRNPI